MRLVRRRDVLVVVFFAVVFGAGPTVGDVGSCGDQATPLDEATFAAQRKAMDCSRCQQCGLLTQTCASACDPTKPSDVSWPSTCYPLQHDGIVCLDALQSASCSSYASFVDDVAPTVPSECDFCHVLPEAGVLVGDP